MIDNEICGKAWMSTGCWLTVNGCCLWSDIEADALKKEMKKDNVHQSEILL